MILDLREFDDFPAQTVITASPGEFSPFADSVIRVEETTVDLAIQKAGEEYFCQGRAKARVVMECARSSRVCHELSGKTDFVVSSRPQSDEQSDVIDDEEYVYFQGSDFRVDITEPIRQVLILAVPLKPLCAETCRGLCASCGANLNETGCDCKRDNTDPRWEGLKGFLPEDERK
jgi:uncharacterized protein